MCKQKTSAPQEALSGNNKSSVITMAEAAERIGEITGVHRIVQQERIFMKRHGLN